MTRIETARHELNGFILMEHELCMCNNCDAVLIDYNPQVDAPKYTLNGNEKHMIIVGEGEDTFWACPNCKTDGYLSDTL